MHLEEFREELLNSRNSDIDQVNLLHQIGTLSVEFFRAAKLLSVDKKFLTTQH